MCGTAGDQLRLERPFEEDPRGNRDEAPKGALATGMTPRVFEPTGLSSMNESPETRNVLDPRILTGHGEDTLLVSLQTWVERNESGVSAALMAF